MTTAASEHTDTPHTDTPHTDITPTDTTHTDISPTDAAALSRLGTATLYEASGLDCYLPPRVRPVWPGAAVVGRALPVSTAPADNLPLHLALEQALPGDVLVVDGRQEACGYWGEVLTAAAQARGVLGLVIDGGYGTPTSCAGAAFPCSVPRWPCAPRSRTTRAPSVPPVTLGLATVNRGDLVVADADGVVVIPRAATADVLAGGLAREAAEARYMSRIAEGELTLDIYGFRPDPTD